jgi:hypothetical protein
MIKSEKRKARSKEQEAKTINSGIEKSQNPAISCHSRKGCTLHSLFFTLPREAIEPEGIIFFCFFYSLFTPHSSYGIMHQVVRSASKRHFRVAFRSRKFWNNPKAGKTIRFPNRTCK